MMVMSLRAARPLTASALPMASVLTLITALVHVAAGGETPTAAGVLLAVALTHIGWVALTSGHLVRRLGQRRAHYLGFGIIASLQAITHHLFGFGTGEATIVAHHGHIVVDAGAHAAHGFNLAMVGAHAGVTFLMLGVVAGCDSVLASIATTCADLRQRWRILVTPLLVIRVETSSRLDLTTRVAVIERWFGTSLSVRGPPLGS